MSEISPMMPRLSVVIPTMGRDILIQTLESLANSEGFIEIEVIVAGKIPDPAVAVRLQNICKAHANIRHLDIQFATGDSSQKKNAGAAKARASLIAFLDDDVIVAADWPRRIVEPFEDGKVGLASGPSLIPDDLNYAGRLAGLVLSSRAAGYVAERYRQNREDLYPINWDRVIGCNAIYRREAFEQMGGFPADFYPGEEMIAAYRTEQAGWKLMFVPAAWVNHYPRQTLGRFWRQMWSYGATRIRLIRAGVSFTPMPLVPGLWVAITLALAALSPFWRWAGWLLAVDLFFYAALVAGVTLVTTWRTRKLRDLGLLFMIPFMHAAYGMAQWVELFRPGRDFSEAPRGGRSAWGERGSG